MGFLQKVEAALIAADVTVALRPIKINKILKKDAKPVGKSKKARSPKAPSPRAAEGKEEVGFSSLTNTKKLTPFIEKELQLTDPFNFTNDTWARFTKNVAPKLLTALLLDMNVVPRSRKAEFARYLERRLRALAKT
jgi:hypothetical protein